MKKLFFLTNLFFIGLLSCQNPNPPITNEEKAVVSEVKLEFELYEALQFICNNDTIKINYPDSLKRVFRIDSTTICEINMNYIEDSVDIIQIRLGGLTIPISDSISYSIRYGFDKSVNNNKAPIYDIRFDNNYSKIDSNSYIIFRKLNDVQLNQKIVNVVKSFNSNFESKSISLNEFNNEK